ncbi:hypothetical protein [Marinobacter halodurans]|uniref:hypothetical protein n=1 Tax=Marinobacter halodurans TaxID=2528979 RepID=UPI001A954930|nr:hypothetical protein [Marinobacter halodurans]
MREQFEQNMQALFGDKDAIVVSDNQQLVDWLTGQEIKATTFAQIEASEQALSHVLAVPLNYNSLPLRHVLRKIFANSSVLWYPLASFSPDLDIAKYSLEMFAYSDIVATVYKNRQVVAQLLMADQEVTLRGPGTELTIGLPDTLELLGRTRIKLMDDEHVALGNYFEVAVSPTDLAGKVDSQMTVSGTFRIDSILAATHREFQGTATSEEINQLADEIRQACPLQVTVENSRIVRGLEQWSDRLQAMCGPDDAYRSLTEVAIGTGVVPLDKVDWSLNTVFNEGATGVHIGVGNGLNGVHFDFISQQAQLLDPAAPPLPPAINNADDTLPTIQLVDSIHLRNDEDGGALVVDDRTFVSARVNESALILLQALRQPVTQEYLTDIAVQSAGYQQEQAEQLVTLFVDQLKQNAWIR